MTDTVPSVLTNIQILQANKGTIKKRTDDITEKA
jgi:hypothetical protein